MGTICIRLGGEDERDDDEIRAGKVIRPGSPIEKVRSDAVVLSMPQIVVFLPLLHICRLRMMMTKAQCATFTKRAKLVSLCDATVHVKARIRDLLTSPAS